VTLRRRLDGGMGCSRFRPFWHLRASGNPGCSAHAGLNERAGFPLARE